MAPGAKARGERKRLFVGWSPTLPPDEPSDYQKDHIGRTGDCASGLAC